MGTKQFIKLFKSLAPGRVAKGKMFEVVVNLFLLVFIFASSAFSSEGIENEWGGHLKVNGSCLYYDSISYYGQSEADKGFDGFVDLRVKDKLIISDHLYFEVHYNVLFEGGDSYEEKVLLKKQFSGFPAVADKISAFVPTDDSSFFNFTKIIKETDKTLLLHRLDRFFISYKSFLGDIIAGRQAISWGNGLVFNPMDLFNPFSPSDISRDYKNGDDLILVRINSEKAGDPQLLYIPRREKNSGTIREDQSSFAAKLHFFAEKANTDLLLARHFDETIAGIGVSGNFFDAAWRSDLVYSTLNNSHDRSSQQGMKVSQPRSNDLVDFHINKYKEGFLSCIANIDYSWVWKGKNLYGLLEYYYNGLGKKESTDAFFDPQINERLRRGEIFTLCQDYLSVQLQLETHPLFNISVNIISNLNDDSGLIQQRAVWSVTQNSSLDFGINKAYGKKGTEFGGVALAGTAYYFKSPENVYMTLSYYF